MSQKLWWALVVPLIAASCARDPSPLAVDAAAPEPEFSTLADSAPVVTASTSLHADNDESALRPPTASDALRLIEIRRRCGRDPKRCSFGDIAVPGSPYDRALRTLMRERIELGLRTRSGDGEFRPTVTSIERRGPRDATVHTCVFDALVLYDTKTIPDAHIVFDDHAVSIISTWSMRLHEGRWKWYSEDESRYVPLRDACS
jgi:hypothetical protein